MYKRPSGLLVSFDIIIACWLPAAAWFLATSYSAVLPGAESIPASDYADYTFIFYSLVYLNVEIQTVYSYECYAYI